MAGLAIDPTGAAAVLVVPELMTIIFLVWVIVVLLVMLYQTFTGHGPNLSK